VGSTFHDVSGVVDKLRRLSLGKRRKNKKGLIKCHDTPFFNYSFNFKTNQHGAQIHRMQILRDIGPYWRVTSLLLVKIFF
jgi:hypothetical protein